MKQTKIVKKIFAVLALSVVLVTAVVVPCFAWEWNSTNSLVYAVSTTPLARSVLSSSGFNADPMGNEITPNNEHPNFTINYQNIASGVGNTVTSEMLANGITDEIFEELFVLRQGENNTYWEYYPLSHFDNNADLSASERIALVGERGYQLYSGDAVGICSQYVNYLSTQKGRLFQHNFENFAIDPELLPLTLIYDTYHRESQTQILYNGLDAALPYGVTAPEFTISGIYYAENGSAQPFNYSSQAIIRNTELYDSQYGTYTLAQSYIGLDIYDYLQTFDNRDESKPISIYNLSVWSPVSVTGYRYYTVCGTSRIPSSAGITADFVTSVRNTPPSPSLPVDEIDTLGDFLATAVGGFLDFEIIPGISLTAVLGVFLCIAVVIAVLKIFAGG